MITVLAFVLLFSLAGCGGKSENGKASTIYGIHVSGSKLLIKSGDEIVLRGINYMRLWSEKSDADNLQEIADSGANCVRVLVSDG